LKKEYYVSLTIQSAIVAGLRFAVFDGQFESFGTPEELEDALKGGTSHD
jgi:hypothetical protein